MMPLKYHFLIFFSINSFQKSDKVIIFVNYQSKEAIMSQLFLLYNLHRT